EEIHSLLSSFSDQAKVLIISGREHTDLEKWFGNTRADLIAEHGSWYKENRRWVKPRHSPGPWKENILHILRDLAVKTPGALVEEKSSSVAFHYRKTDRFLAEMRIPQLNLSLTETCIRYSLEILHGDKVIEIRHSGIHKGNAVTR